MNQHGKKVSNICAQQSQLSVSVKVVFWCYLSVEAIACFTPIKHMVSTFQHGSSTTMKCFCGQLAGGQCFFLCHPECCPDCDVKADEKSFRSWQHLQLCHRTPSWWCVLLGALDDAAANHPWQHLVKTSIKRALKTWPVFPGIMPVDSQGCVFSLNLSYCWILPTGTTGEQWWAVVKLVGPVWNEAMRLLLWFGDCFLRSMTDGSLLPPVHMYFQPQWLWVLKG